MTALRDLKQLVLTSSPPSILRLQGRRLSIKKLQRDWRAPSSLVDCPHRQAAILEEVEALE